MTEFKEFRVGDLFEDKDFESIPQIKSQAEIEDAIDGIPYVVQSLSNNMVARYVSEESLHKTMSKILSGNRLVMGVTTCAFSYQPCAFSGSQVITLNLKNLSRNVGLYLLTCFQKYSYKFSYNNKPGLKKYKNLMLRLPVTADGSPDWKEMETVVDTVEQQHVDTVDKTLSAAGFSSYEDTIVTDEEQDLLNAWMLAQTKSERSASAHVPFALSFNEFRIVDLFNIILRGDISNQSKLYTEDAKSDPYLVSQGENSILKRVFAAKYKTFNVNNNERSLCIGRQTGSVLLMKHPFVTTDGVLVLSAGYSENVFLYIQAILSKALKLVTYSNTLSANTLGQMTIQLPVEKDNTINYAIINMLVIIFKKLSIQNLRSDLDKKLDSYKRQINI